MDRRSAEIFRDPRPPGAVLRRRIAHPAPGRVPTLAPDSLYQMLGQELRAIATNHMRAEPAGHVLQTTALINEAYVRLRQIANPSWSTRAEFLAAAARTIRRILIDHARAARAARRGGDVERCVLSGDTLDDRRAPIDLLDLDAALEKLAAVAPRHAQVVELRFFAALSDPEIADQLGISRRTVQSDWRFARAWLRRALDAGGDAEPATSAL